MKNLNYLMYYILYWINKIENSFTFRIKTGYYLELLPPETMSLLGITKSKITNNKIGEEIAEVVLIDYNIVNNYYQQDSSVLYTFVFNKSLLHLFLIKTFSSEFSYIEVWFTGQNSKPLETEDKINITLVIN